MRQIVRCFIPNRRASTRAEVLAVALFVCLLAMFLATGMTENRERAARARCLANLRLLASGAQAYSAEDTLDQAVPLHASMVRMVVNETGWSLGWGWRTAARFAYGGQTSTTAFPQSQNATPDNFTTVMLDPTGVWGAAARPLNPYVIGSLDNSRLESLDAFRCPADQGYPDNDHTANRDIPRSAAGMPCIEILGNSYNFRPAGAVWPYGTRLLGWFSVAAAGHRLDSLQDVSRVVLFSDAPFVSMTRDRRALDHPPVNFVGWHGQLWADNASFVDGSARLSACGDLMLTWDSMTLQEMNYTDPNGGSDPSWFLVRGRSWRLDGYPTPGARIAMRDAAGAIVTPSISTLPATAQTRWPFLGYQDVTP